MKAAPTEYATRVTIPGVGTFQPTFDRIDICSDVPRTKLLQHLPIKLVEQLSHTFNIEKRRGKRGSRLVFTCLPDRKVLKLLRQHEAALGSYRVTTVETA